MKKRIMALLTAVLLLVAMVPAGSLTAFAEENDDAVQLNLSGTGTESDPYLIQSASDLTNLAGYLNSGAAASDNDDDDPGNFHGSYFKLTADLDLSDITWTPIGKDGSTFFAGNFDGDGHTISNVNCHDLVTAGLFGWVAFGSVSNLTVEKANISALGTAEWGNNGFAGGLLGVAYSAEITDCQVRDSKISSSRTIANTNMAGGFVGDSYRATFEKCASVNNEITTSSYGGGFVATLDDGNNQFTNCYAVNCKVTANSTGWTQTGMFMGESQGGNAAFTNCYVYNCKTELAAENTGNNLKGILCIPSRYGTVTVSNSYYYADGNTDDYKDVNGETKMNGLSAKTKDEFRSLAETLGDAFVQGTEYPVLASEPADYSKVDAAIEEANSLTSADYTDFSGVTKAVNDVVRGKKVSEQSEVDAMAAAIVNAINGLVKNPTVTFTKSDGTTESVMLKSGSTLPPDSRSGYTFKGWTFKAGETEIGNSDGTTLSEELFGKLLESSGSTAITATAVFEQNASLVIVPTTYRITIPSTENGSLSASPTAPAAGSRVTITVSPDEGYELDSISAKNDTGREVSLTKNANGTYSFTQGTSPVTITATFKKTATPAPELEPSENKFVDVPNTGDLPDAVSYGVTKGFIKGEDDTHFNPAGAVTRAQFVAFLYRLTGSAPVTTANDFTDVKKNSSLGGSDFYDAINWAVAEKIAFGYGDGSFRPFQTVTRAEAVAFLNRYKGGSSSAVAPYTDVDQKAWYAKNVNWAYGNGITVGKSETIFGINDDTTRGEAVQFIYRAEK